MPLNAFIFRRSNTDKGQIQGSLQRPSEVGIGEGVPLQPVHHHQEEGRARKQRGVIRKTGKYLKLQEY